MQTVTVGHISTNGGIRGHSAGDFYPYRVMVQGTMDNLKYVVINPDGSKMNSWKTCRFACDMASLMKSFDDIG